MNNPKIETRHPKEVRSPKSELTVPKPRSVLECGGQRSATPLSSRTETEANEENEGSVLRFLGCSLSNPSGRKRRRRRALPAQSKTWRLLLACLLLSTLTEARGLAESVLDCGGKSDATPLWHRTTPSRFSTLWAARKRRRRCALPAHSKTWRLLLACLLLSTLHPQLSTVFAQGTAFTYQGRLNDGVNPASGIYDLRFTIYDLPGAGAAVAGPLTNAPVAVSNGLFTVALDFGAVFNGAPRWLEIGVRPGGGAGDFTTLSPRQAISPTPYAMFATTAGTVPNGAITANKLASGSAAANLQAGGQAAVGGGGVVLSEQFNATELLTAGYQKIGRVSLIDEEWLQRASGPAGLPPALARRGHSAVWTGTEMIIWGGVDKDGVLLNTGGRYHPAAGIWTPISTSNAPAPRLNHRAVWTGTEMIVHGGNAVAFGMFGGGGTAVTNTGGRYNPATDTWTPITPGGGNRQNHSAFWTGSEMLVWGGTAVSSGIFTGGTVPRNDGARYNLAADNWTAISTTSRPSARFDYSAVFTGTEMIIWGGRDCVGSFLCTETNYNDGARYNVAANAWTPINLAGAPFRRFGHSAVWSGTEMIVWGGQYAEGFLDLVRSNFNNGARYNAAANTWSPITQTATPTARFGQSAVWAGNRMVVWGGTDGTNLFDSGARYFPTANAWSNMTSTARPVARTGHTAIWSGNEMIVWGGFNEFLRDLGGRYHATNDVWTPTPPTGEHSERRGHTAIWTGNEVLVWGGFDGERYLNTGGRYVPSLNSWTPITTNGAPEGRVTHTAVWTGTEMIVWGGVGTGAYNTGARYNPANGAWTAMTTNGAPTARTGHTAVWTGSQMIIWGGLAGALTNTGARYNPANNTWTVAATASAPAGRTGHAAVWTGTEMLVWGGAGGTLLSPVALASGGRYNPNNNTWANLPNPSAPAARMNHRAIWTGDEMLVWGGTDLTTNLNTGGRYNRAANSWSAMTTNNAPSPRVEHTAVWDGTRMIVWGGTAGDDLYLQTGGIYNPLTDDWLPTDAIFTNAPPARTLHAAAWTGTEMVVHGGYRADNAAGTETYLDDTWHYTPPRTLFLYLKP
jgi:N-acetylneuraminic acid mutarotase